MSLIGSEVRFEDYPLLLKLVWVKDQPGVKAVEAAADSVRNMGTKLGETSNAADASMRGLGMSWAGPAADAAQRSSAQLTRGAEQTQQLSDNGAQRILEYGRSFEDLRPRIQWEDTSHLNWLDVPTEGGKVAHDLMPWVADEDKISALTRNMDRDEEANRALEVHRIRAQMADDAFAIAGVDPPPPSGGDGGAVTPGPVGGDTFSPLSSAGPHVASASVAPSGTTSAQPAPPAAAPPTGTGTTSGPGSTPFPATPVGGPAGVVPSGAGAGPGRDGAASGRGGTAPGVGGTASGAGTAPGAGGTAPGVGGTAPGMGGTASSVGAPGMGPTGGTRGTGTAAGPTGAAGAGAAGRVPDPGQARARLGEQFGRDVTAGSPGFRAGPGGGGPDPSGTGRSIGGLAPGMRGGAGTGWTSGGSPYGRRLPPGEAGSRSGGAWRGGLGENTSRLPGEIGPRAWSRAPGMPGEGVRPVMGEAGTAGRPGAGYGSGFAPMMGGVGGMRGDGDAHRNRYLLPSSEPFDVDLPHAPPVLGPDEEDQG